MALSELPTRLVPTADRGAAGPAAGRRALILALGRLLGAPQTVLEGSRLAELEAHHRRVLHARWSSAPSLTLHLAEHVVVTHFAAGGAKSTDVRPRAGALERLAGWWLDVTRPRRSSRGPSEALRAASDAARSLGQRDYRAAARAARALSKALHRLGLPCFRDVRSAALALARSVEAQDAEGLLLARAQLAAALRTATNTLGPHPVAVTSLLRKASPR